MIPEQSIDLACDTSWYTLSSWRRLFCVERPGGFFFVVRMNKCIFKNIFRDSLFSLTHFQSYLLPPNPVRHVLSASSVCSIVFRVGGIFKLSVASLVRRITHWDMIIKFWHCMCIHFSVSMARRLAIMLHCSLAGDNRTLCSTFSCSESRKLWDQIICSVHQVEVKRERWGTRCLCTNDRTEAADCQACHRRVPCHPAANNLWQIKRNRIMY